MQSSNGIRLMAHLVAGFPTIDESFTVAEALAAGGADILEVQFPFSDPCADGKPIQEACSTALEAGTKVADGFGLVEKIRRVIGVPVFIMTYGNLIYSMGVERFVELAAAVGADGIIAPDLMPGYDEGLYACGRKHSVAIVPVITPQVSDERLGKIRQESPQYLYCALRSGITGEATRLDDENIGFLQCVRPVSPVIMAGFGIQSPEQVAALAPHADVAIAGSVFVREIQQIQSASAEVLHEKVRNRAAGLVHRH